MAQSQSTSVSTQDKIQTIAEEIRTLIDAMVQVRKMITEVEQEIARRFN